MNAYAKSCLCGLVIALASADAAHAQFGPVGPNGPLGPVGPDHSPSVYSFRGPNTRVGGVRGTIYLKYEYTGRGKWKRSSYSDWEDGRSDPETISHFVEIKRGPGTVELKHRDDPNQVRVALTSDGTFIFRTWPGHPYPYEPPHVERWWREPGDGRWVQHRPW
jgi:hypothetical protein